MKPSWTSLDLTEIHLANIQTFFHSEVTSILSFIDQNLELEPENTNLLPRDYYKEFQELSKPFLAGNIDPEA